MTGVSVDLALAAGSCSGGYGGGGGGGFGGGGTGSVGPWWVSLLAVGLVVLGIIVAAVAAWRHRRSRREVEWRRRLDDFARKGWRNVVEARSGPDVEYVGLVNRACETEDRVVVRVTARLEDDVRERGGGVVLKNGERSTTTTLQEWWTLAPPGER